MKTRKWIARVGVAAGAFVLSSVPGTFGQECPEQVDTLPTDRFGAPWLLKSSGSYAYVVTHSTHRGWSSECLSSAIAIVDTSDPEGPRIVSLVEGNPGIGVSVCTDLIVRDFGVSDDRLFVIGTFGVIDFINVSDPRNPVRVPDFYRIEIDGPPTTPAAFKVDVSGDFVYVTSPDGLTILDVSDIEKPTRVGFLESSWRPSDLAVAANHAYVADPWEGLRIIDVSNPENPREVGLWATTWEARDLAVLGDLLYVADGDGGLRILDIDNPSDPFEVGSFATKGEARKVSVEGSLAAVALGYDGVSIIDVSNSARPVEMDRYTTVESAWDVALKNGTAFIATNHYLDLMMPSGEPYRNTGGFRVVDVTVPERATELASFEFESVAMEVAVAEGMKYFANGHIGLNVTESIDPRYRQSAFLDTPGFAVGVTPHGDLALVADDHKGLRIIDVSDPSHLVEVGFVDTPGQSRRVAVAADLAFVADGDAGLRIIDISTPSNPEEVGFLDTTGQAVDVAVSGEWVYVADGPGGLRVVNVSDPTQPIENSASPFPVLGGARSVAVVDQRLFVARNGKIEILDITDPASPSSLGDVGKLRGLPTDIAVSGNYAYVATHSDQLSEVSGVDVFDFSDPRNPIRAVGAWDSSGDAWGLAASGESVYVAGGKHGVQILDTRCLTTYWVELVAHQSGAHDSLWRSDVVIGWRLDPWPREPRTEIAVEFLLHTKDGVFKGEAVVPPYSSAVFEDIVGLLGYEGKGALEIRAEAPVWVSSRVYNLTESGTSGAYYPGYRSSDCLDGPLHAFLYGLRQVEGEYRTNISITNTAAEAQEVSIYLYSANGTALDHYTLWVETRTTVQDLQPFKRRANRPEIGWGYAVVAPGRYSRGILASATVIDSRTNDALVVPMVPEVGIGEKKR